MFNNKKVNRVITFIICLLTFLLFIFSIINDSVQSSKTEEYRKFYNLANIFPEYYEFLLMEYNFNYMSEFKATNIVVDFINLKTNESISSTYRIIIAIISILFCFFYCCFASKIKNLNDPNYKKTKCQICCYNITLIIEIIMIFYEIIDSIIMINFRKNKIIPYIKILFSNYDDSKFNSSMNTCKNFDILFIIILSIFFLVLIFILIKRYIKNKNCCCDKCCENDEEETNDNQNFNQPYLYNPNYNNNIYNRNPHLVNLRRNVANGQYIIVDNNQNLNNNLNSHNNINPNRIENVPINIIYYREIVNNRNINDNNNNNNNNINDENNRESNNEIFFKKLLEKCNIDKFNKNKYKKYEDCRICLMKFENNDDILILPCFHIFHFNCINDWLKNKTTCPLDNQNLENYL